VTHDLSVSTSRFERMSLTAVAIALLLHAALGVTVWVISEFAPRIPPVEEAIEVTVEQPPPKPPPPEAAQPPPPPQAAAAPPIDGVRPPAPLTADKATQVPPPADPGKEAMAPQRPSNAPIVPPIIQPDPAERAQPEPPKEAAAAPKPSDPAPPAPREPAPPSPAIAPEPLKEAALAPQPLPPPAQPVPEPAPPKHEPPPSPPQSHALAVPPPPRPAPPMPHPELQPSPLRPGPQRQAPSVTPSDRPSPSPFVNPADAYNRAQASDNYLWLVGNKLAAYSFTTNNGGSRYGIMVVVHVVIARDGRLLEASITRSSGYPEYDRNAIAGLRASSPYPPLPPDIPGPSATFSLPLVAVQR
jgi:TonB family protein